MKDKHSIIIAVDKTNTPRVVLGDLSKTENAIFVIKNNQHSKKSDFLCPHMDESIIKLWDTFSLTQKNAIKEVIQKYRDEVFSIECAIDEGNA
ncbi:TPA: hypothetical protein ACK1SE_000261 [Proteus mirabilis]|nr:hypothetical protein [Proteus mirabilis]